MNKEVGLKFRGLCKRARLKRDGLARLAGRGEAIAHGHQQPCIDAALLRRLAGLVVSLRDGRT